MRQVSGAVGSPIHIGRWIANGNDYTNDLYSPNFVQGGSNVQDSCFLVFYFEGCTPSTTIGSITVRSSMCHKPTDAQVGVYDLKVRGKYPGTDNWIHQLKTNGINL